MSQVLLIEDDQNLKELLSMNLSTYLGVEVIPRETAQDAIDLINILPTVSLVICKSNIKSEQSAEKLIEFMKKDESTFDLIIVGSDNSELKSHAALVKDGNDWEQVVSITSKILGIEYAAIKDKVRPDYVPVPVENFSRLKTSCCDVFIRIKKSPVDFQYIKRINAGESFTNEEISRYSSQGLKNFYISQDRLENFTNFLSDRLVKLLENKSKDIDAQIALVGESYDIVKDKIMNSGFSSAVVQLTDSIIDNMLNVFESTDDSKSLLGKVLTSKSSYLYRHSHVTSIVASACLKEMGLGSKEDYQKITYASFFKDIVFIEKEDLAKITCYEELEEANLSEEDWDLVSNHALRSSLLIKDYPDAPEGVEQLIKLHHGASNGKGFSINQVKNIATLEVALLIASEFAKETILIRDNKKDLGEIIDDLFKKFPTPDMGIVINIIKGALLSNK